MSESGSRAGDPFAALHSQEHPNRDVAILVLINPKSEILMVRTRRLPNHWQSVGGGIAPDDISAKHAVAREVNEEIGIEIRVEDMVALCEAPYDFGGGIVHSFFACLQSDTKLSIDDAEIAEAQWFTLADALTLPMFPAMAYTLRSLASRHDLRWLATGIAATWK